MQKPNDGYKAISDEELALLAQKGDEKAFVTLVERFEPKLSRYGTKFLSDTANIEDTVQDVFIKVYQNMQSFDATRRFSPWIYRIAHNEFVNALRKVSRGAVPVFDFDALVAHHVYEDPIIEAKEKEEMNVLLKKGLEALAPDQREILVLHYIEGLSYKEIVDVLQIPQGTVGVRILRARAALKKYVLREQNRR